MTTKELQNGEFKKAKLARTRARRERLAGKRRMEETLGRAGRNDLLPQLKITYLPTRDLRPPRNRTRKDNSEHLNRHVSSIARFGFSLPIMVRKSQVIDGWTRILAARELGLDQVPVIECDHLDDGEARALALALNRIGELGEWDLDILRLEFSELIELDVELDGTGFTFEEQDLILLDPLDDDEKIVEGDLVDSPPEVPVTRLGDIWILDGHRIICGDARSEETYLLLLGEEEQVHMVLQDPPYNVKIQGNVSGLGAKVHEEFVMASGEMSREEFASFLDGILACQVRFLPPGAMAYVFMDFRSFHLLYAAAEKAGLTLLNLVVWYKGSGGGMGSLYRSAHELLPVFCKGKTPRCNNVLLGAQGRNRSNVWEAPGANRRGSSANEMLDQHATPKPVPLCEDAILDVTKRGEIVLDGFLGSGTTLIAAENTGRLCRGVELEPGFVDVSVRRWERHTGGEAVHAETGETFAEIAARRAGEGAADADGDTPDEGDGQ